MGCPVANPDDGSDDGDWVLTLSVDPDAVELVTSLLWDEGTTGVAEVGERLLAGFTGRRVVDAVAARAAGWPVRVESIEPVSWTGDDSTTTAVVEAASGRFELAITAGPTFGHGAHPTTALALELLVDVLDPPTAARAPTSPPAVLDVGTGSGVLAITAARLGADPVVGIDIDPAVPEVAGANARANGATVVVADDDPAGAVERIGGRRFDVVVANVLLVAQRELAPAIAAALAPGGILVTAGYLVDDEDALVDLHRSAIDAAGLGPAIVIGRRERDGWAANRFDLARPDDG